MLASDKWQKLQKAAQKLAGIGMLKTQRWFLAFE